MGKEGGKRKLVLSGEKFRGAKNQKVYKSASSAWCSFALECGSKLQSQQQTGFLNNSELIPNAI